jgi:hypothetical protein
MKRIFKYLFIIAALITGGMIYSSCSDMSKSFEPEIYQYPDITITDFTPKTGRPGDQITITGTNFGNYPKAAKILFNGVLASNFVSYSDKQMVVRVPADAGVGPISVTVWTHTEVFTNDFAFNPGAKIIGLSPSEGLPDAQITITGERFGTDLSKVSASFFSAAITGGVPAKIVSVQDNAIVLKVPSGADDGPITLVVDGQVLNTGKFKYTSRFAYGFSFNTDGNAEGWLNSWGQNNTLTVSGGVLDINVTGTAGDIRNPAVTLNPAKQPYFVVKVSSAPASVKFGLNLYDGKADWRNTPWVRKNGELYIFNIGSFAGLAAGDVQVYLLSSNVKNGDHIVIDWMRTYASIDDAMADTPLPAGKHTDDFDEFPSRIITPLVLDDWTGRTDVQVTSTVYEDGYAKVSFTPGSPDKKSRADFNHSMGGKWAGGSLDTKPWHYNPEYPIYAIKIQFVQADGTLGGPRPKVGTIKYDRLGEFNNDLVDKNVLWVDARNWQTVETFQTSWWAVVIADLASDEKGYWVDWHRTFKSVDELKAFVGK